MQTRITHKVPRPRVLQTRPYFAFLEPGEQPPAAAVDATTLRTFSRDCQERLDAYGQAQTALTGKTVPLADVDKLVDRMIAKPALPTDTLRAVLEYVVVVRVRLGMAAVRVPTTQWPGPRPGRDLQSESAHRLVFELMGDDAREYGGRWKRYILDAIEGKESEGAKCSHDYVNPADRLACAPNRLDLATHSVSFSWNQPKGVKELKTLANTELIAALDYLRERDTDQHERERPSGDIRLTDAQRAVLGVITEKQPILGKHIVMALGGTENPVELANLTRHIIPYLKQHCGVRNRSGSGYYRD